MTIHLTDTTTSKIDATLTQARHRLGGPAIGMVLTLVIITDEAEQYDAVRAAEQAAREHPSRVLVVIGRDAKAEPRLDAELRIGESGPGETLLLRLYGALGKHAGSVVSPLLLTDTPVVAWWTGPGPEAPSRDPLGRVAQRRITDVAAAARSPESKLSARAATYSPGDTDFAWTRITPWRTLLAAALDQPFPQITGGMVGAAKNNPSGDLLAAWLGARLDVPMEREVTDGPGVTDVRLRTSDGEIALTRPDGRVATLSRPGDPDRTVALHRRATSELLAEELRRLDPDEIYAETLHELSGEKVGA